IPYTLETDCPLGVGGFEPLHFRIGNCIIRDAVVRLLPPQTAIPSLTQMPRNGGVSFHKGRQAGTASCVYCPAAIAGGSMGFVLCQVGGHWSGQCPHMLS
ncbi:MAG: hypothetical protein QOI46_3782, partial [Alphaproteobacteria bacterium]|nr:hypothetical protein [Alphaproteobacteria bacterium]